MKKANIIVSVLLIALAILLIVDASTYTKVDPNDVGLAFFPMVVAGLLIVLALILLLTSIFKKVEEVSPGFFGRKQLKSYLAIGVILVYLIVMPYVGFCVSSALFLFVLIRLFGYHKYWLNAVVSIASSALIYVLFKLLLNVPLPAGFLI